MVKFGAATSRLRERGKRPAGKKRARQPSSSHLILGETNVALFHSVSCVIVKVRALGCVSQKRRPCFLHLCTSGGGGISFLSCPTIGPTHNTPSASSQWDASACTLHGFLDR